MKDLTEYLARKRDWLASTPGTKHANCALSLQDLTAVLDALKPRKLGPQEPRGTNRSPEEIAKMYAGIQASADEAHKEWVAILRAEA